ncbi:hypothetical protein RSJ42_03375 [Methanosarcina hadiensis]
MSNDAGLILKENNPVIIDMAFSPTRFLSFREERQPTTTSPPAYNLPLD